MRDRSTEMRMLVYPEPVTLASFAKTQGPIGQVTSKIYEGLVTYDIDMNPVAQLAESWTLSDDMQSFQFKLRSDVLFHDGSAFSAEDVKFSFYSVLKERHPRGCSTLKNLVKVDTPDPHSVVFKFSRPVPYFMSTLSAIESPIMPHGLDGCCSLEEYAQRERPIGTGSFQIMNWVRGNEIILERNSHHWKRETDGPDVIRVVFEDRADKRIDMFQNGTVHLGGMGALPMAAGRALQQEAGLYLDTVGQSALNPVLFIEFNASRAPFDDVFVRQMVRDSVCSKTILSQAFSGFGEEMTGPLHSSWIKRGLVKTNHAPEPLNIQCCPSFPPEEITLDCIPYGDEWRAAAELVCGMLKDMGFKVRLRDQSFSAWMERIFVRRDFDLTLNYVHYYSDPALSLNRLHHSESIGKARTFANSSGWSTDETDALIDAATVEVDKNVRAATYGQLADILYNEAPCVWIAEISPLTAVNDAYRHLLKSPFGVYGPIY